MPGALCRRHVRLRIVPNLPDLRDPAVPDRCGRGGSRPDVARLHGRQVPLRNTSDCARPLHERLDDGPDHGEHARRHLRAVSRLAKHFHRVRHRRSRRFGPARARGSAIPGTAENRPAVRVADACRAARRVGDLPRHGRRALDRALPGAGRSRRVPADLCPGHAVRRHVEAAQRAIGARDRAARRSLRLWWTCPIWRLR